MNILYIVIALLLIFYVLLRELGRGLLPYGAALQCMTNGDFSRAARLFEIVLRRPTIIRWIMRDDVRYRIAWAYLSSGKPEEGVRYLSDVLAKKMKPAKQALFRRRLAECLEASGQVEEADAERKATSDLLNSAPSDHRQLTVLGQTLCDQKRFTEACEAFEQAIKLLPERWDVGKSEIMARLALAYFEACKPNESIRWAEKAIESGATGIYLQQAHRTASIAYGTLGRLDDVEKHCNKAIELAKTANHTDQAASYMMGLAEVQRKRGHVMEAIRTCEEAAKSSLKAKRMARTVQFECYRVLGHWDEARRSMEQAMRAPGFPVPAAERRSQALSHIGIAWALAEGGKPEEAWVEYVVAEKEVGSEEKVGVMCTSTAAWLLALLGKRDEALAKMQETLDRCAKMPDSRTTQLGARFYLGYAALALGDFEAGKQHFEAYLELEPDPVERPKGMYFLAECELKTGHPEHAHDLMRQAAETDMEIYYTRKARERLKEFAPSPAT